MNVIDPSTIPHTSPEAIREFLSRRWENLTIADDFVFCKTMLNADLCREVLEAILGIQIERVEYIGRQEQLDAAPDKKSVRLDVIVRDGQGTVYNVEMQTVDMRELPRRSRYYHALLALDQVQRGDSYKSLGDTYVIFVCNFDLFRQGRRVYWFENTCRDVPGMPLGDGAKTIFLAANAPRSEKDDGRLNELLDYVLNGAVSGDFSARLAAEVANVLDSQKWRMEYMLLEVRDQLNYDRGEQHGREVGIEQGFSIGHEAGLAEGVKQGREAGLAEGIEQGREAGLAEGIEQGREVGLAEGIEQGREAGLAEGEGRFARLVAALVADGRMADVERVAADLAFRQVLYRAYGIQ